MARLKPQDVKISTTATGDISFRIAGKLHIMSASDMLIVSNTLGNAAADMVTSVDRLPIVRDIMLKPFDQSGHAMLRLVLDQGPMHCVIDAHQLAGLAQASSAALEQASPLGSA